MASETATRSPAQLFALVFGIVYALVGVVGFAVTGFGDFAGAQGDDLIIFALNPLHNVVHLGVGALWIWSATKHETAKTINLLIGSVYALVAALGFVGALDFLAIDGAADPDNFLHIASAGLGLYFGTSGAASRPATA